MQTKKPGQEKCGNLKKVIVLSVSSENPVMHVAYNYGFLLSVLRFLKDILEVEEDVLSVSFKRHLDVFIVNIKNSCTLFIYKQCVSGPYQSPASCINILQLIFNEQEWFQSCHFEQNFAIRSQWILIVIF